MTTYLNYKKLSCKISSDARASVSMLDYFLSSETEKHALLLLLL